MSRNATTHPNTEPAQSDQQPAGPLVYTVKETAELLTLSLTGTYALIRAGKIPAVQLGGRWVVPKQRFHAWLNTQVDHAGQLSNPDGGAWSGGAR